MGEEQGLSAENVRLTQLHASFMLSYGESFRHRLNDILNAARAEGLQPPVGGGGGELGSLGASRAPSCVSAGVAETPSPGSYWLFQATREHTDPEQWRALVADANRYRFLREFCGSAIGMTWEQPAECGIYWEWQQATPDQRFWTIDNAVDADLQRRVQHEAEEWAEDNAPAPPTDCQTSGGEA